MFTLQQVFDEGTTEPFIARLWVGIFEFRDEALGFSMDSKNIERCRNEFDDLYSPVLNNIEAARKAARKIGRIVEEHKNKLVCGSIVSFQPTAMVIGESIDSELRDDLSEVLSKGTRALKGVQKVTKFPGVDIGCVFTKQANFITGIEKMRDRGEDALAEFLGKTRSEWSGKFIKRRDALEHEGWQLPTVKYSLNADGSVEMIEPQVDGLTVSLYAKKMVERIMSFVENIVVHSFQGYLRPLASVAEIAEDRRDPTFPKRFKLIYLPGSDTEEWIICYSPNDFTDAPMTTV